jgi:hypothetical protein
LDATKVDRAPDPLVRPTLHQRQGQPRLAAVLTPRLADRCQARPNWWASDRTPAKRHVADLRATGLSTEWLIVPT